MRVTSFEDVDKLIPCPHEIFGIVYIPELSTFELEDYTATVAAHSVKYAENKFIETKEMEENLPLSSKFNFNNEHVAVWQGREKPKNLYEEKVMNKAMLTFTQITLTMFLCDVEGKCLCPFDEPFGTLRNDRIKLFSNFSKDEAAVRNFNRLLLGIEEEKIPNVQKGVKKK